MKGIKIFSTDTQTHKDLQLFGKPGSATVYQLFNHTVTTGGAAILEEMFKNPLADREAIRIRQETIAFIGGLKTSFPLDWEHLGIIEHYLSNRDERTRFQKNETGRFSLNDPQCKNIKQGVESVLAIYNQWQIFLDDIQEGALQSSYAQEWREINHLLKALASAFSDIEANEGNLTNQQIILLDNICRFYCYEILRQLLRCSYRLDVWLTVANVARLKKYCIPEQNEGGHTDLYLQGLYHPLLHQPVPNDLFLSENHNLLFLTGANMAGKSTLMKSMGIALYLAHMGFPVPAASMRFSVMDGMFTSINLSDNLGTGVSHFYAEVLRMKKIVRELAAGRRLVIICDELFRGTNVRDAHEGTLAFTRSFAKNADSIFIISTHIMEAGTQLHSEKAAIRFLYLPTKMEGAHPVYTYRLKEGITDDRQGMLIIQNEKILDILQNGKKIDAADSASAFADHQTLADLNIPGRHKAGSIFNLFNRTKTKKGEHLLEELFAHPLRDANAINARSKLLADFGQVTIDFPFDNSNLELMEQYLADHSETSYSSILFQMLRLKAIEVVVHDKSFRQLTLGIGATLKVVLQARELVTALSQEEVLQQSYAAQINTLRELLSQPELNSIGVGENTALLKTIRIHYLLRHRLGNKLKNLCALLYELDVLLSVSGVAKANGFQYAHALAREAHCFRAAGLRHPKLPNGTTNNLQLNDDHHMLFLTGANMAGKSTLMRSTGIAIYLAHMGFPVAAESMEFSILEGLYTSINVSDNLGLGLSHYYAEVLRVKQVAEAVSAGKNLLIIFDELFKGTNVRDAYDATFAVTEAFSHYSNCQFIISTHIIEVGQALKAAVYGVKYQYLPTLMEGNIPHYTYQLQEGITADKQGMIIIENEGILEMLDNVNVPSRGTKS